MIKPPLRAVISAVLASTPVVLSACASAHDAPQSVDAVLLNPQDTATRQAIRIFVRDKSGSNVITNPDSLSQSPVLSNTQRRAEIGLSRQNARAALTPTGEYRLVMDESNRCWLIHKLQDAVSHLELPSSASCAVYRKP